jgi:hypothetical protein
VRLTVTSTAAGSDLGRTSKARVQTKR